MDDFYSGGKPVSGGGANDDFFAGGPSGRAAQDDFYSGGPSGRTTSTQSSSSNPFDAPAFDMDDNKRADDFFSESTIPGAVSDGSSSSSGDTRGAGREEGDNRYPWQLGWWRDMFDVDTREVAVRVLHSLIPFRRSFVEAVRAKPDLWAPFWIASTLIFFMTWTGNFAAYLNSVLAGNLNSYEARVERLPWGAMAVYGYWLVIPLIFWAIFKWRQVPIPLLLCYCIFGYSLFVYIPVSIVAIIALGPIQWLSWLLIMLACAYSTLTLALSFFFLVYDAEFKLGYLLILFMAACSVGLGLSFKLYFFDYGAVLLTGNATRPFV